MGATGPQPQWDADEAERRECLRQLLASGIFDRAPNLALILGFVCEKYFAGKVNEIKEYNIAVDALGRPAEFDQKRDSIVRVEAHRLRKRLREYYAGPGLNDPVQISLPAGTYVPTFQRLTPSQQVGVTPQPEELPIESVAPAELLDKKILSDRMHLNKNLVVSALALCSIVFCVSCYLIYRGVQTEAKTVSRQVEMAALPIADASEEVRLLAGSDQPRLVDHLGNVWTGDRWVKGGQTARCSPRQIARTLDSEIYFSRREGDFRYDIPVKPGFYEVRLHFAESVFGEGNVAGGGESSRVFAVTVNDDSAIQALDILSNAGGPNTSYIRVVKGVTPLADGKIHLHFFPFMKEQAFVNAIEIVPSGRGKILPVRIVARSSAFVDRDKQEWGPDRFYAGGQYVQRHEPVVGADQPELFQGERYGNFSYVIPVAAKSHYTLTLRFAESWFGPGRPGGGGQGSRSFDVYCNGRALLRRFDPFEAAGGALRAITKTFSHLEATPQGKLLIQFIPMENYALINSIEVTDEGF